MPACLCGGFGGRGRVGSWRTSAGERTVPCNAVNYLRSGAMIRDNKNSPFLSIWAFGKESQSKKGRVYEDTQSSRAAPALSAQLGAVLQADGARRRLATVGPRPSRPAQRAGPVGSHLPHPGLGDHRLVGPNPLDRPSGRGPPVAGRPIPRAAASRRHLSGPLAGHAADVVPVLLAVPAAHRGPASRPRGRGTVGPSWPPTVRGSMPRVRGPTPVACPGPAAPTPARNGG